MAADTIQTDVMVLGSGPGGYAAAFYAADLGRKVLLIEKDERLGGVCLNRGCIPSKALLHVGKLIEETRSSGGIRGVEFAEPVIHLDRLRNWKESVIQKLSQGIAALAKAKGVEVLKGRGFFEESNLLRVETSSGQKFVRFNQGIIAVGSLPAVPKAFDLGNRRIMTSTEALEIDEIPAKLLVVGGGYIGMELGTVYAALGSKVVVVEAMDSILAGADADLVRPVLKKAKESFSDIYLSAKVKSMSTVGKQIKVVMETAGGVREELYDKVLVSVGRVPNCEDLGLEHTQIQTDDKGFIKVNTQQKTDDPSLYAIGDVAGGVLLAHKAAKEARIAVEAMAGQASVNEGIVIPAVVFTDPEVAWCGLTENEARAKNISVEVVRFPWSASGRAISFDRTDGLTKLLIEPETERILGAGIVGAGAGDLISEAVHAIEMGATARDLAETVHPHPTLSETLMEAAELFYGHSAHALSPKKKAHAAS